MSYKDKLISKGSVPGQYIIERFRVKDTDYMIEHGITIFGGIRVRLAQLNSDDPNDFSFYEYDWCAGAEQCKQSSADYLTEVIVKIIEEGRIEEFPACSKRKPFYNDKEFSHRLEKILELPISVKQFVKNDGF
jgi:hypothetical protein